MAVRKILTSTYKFRKGCSPINACWPLLGKEIQDTTSPGNGNAKGC